MTSTFISLGCSQRLKRHSSKRQLPGGHYASEAQATPRVDVGDPPEASSFHLCVRLSCLPLQLQILKGVCCLCHSAWAGIVLACGGEQGSFQRWLDATVSTVGVLKVRHREYARSGNWTRPCSFMPLSSAVVAGCTLSAGVG